LPLGRFRKVLTLLPGLAAAMPLLASDWKALSVDDAGNHYSVDRSRIVRTGRQVKAVVRTEYATARPPGRYGKPLFAAVDRLVVDCDERSFALEARTYVASDGEEIPAVASDGAELEFRPARAGSMSATLVDELCGPVREP
jgi:hypothetical protein